MGQDTTDYTTIGKRIRERRLQFGWSTQKLAETAGVARYTVVRIESGTVSRKETLQKIRHALRLWTAQMTRPFPDSTDFGVHRFEDQHWAVSLKKSQYQKHIIGDNSNFEDDPAERRRLGDLGFQPFFTSIFTSNLPFGMTEHALMEIHQPSWVDSHYGEEFIYCLRGGVTITVNGQRTDLRPGDAICFDAKHPHQYEPTPPIEKDSDPSLILIVVTKRPSKSSKKHSNVASGK